MLSYFDMPGVGAGPPHAVKGPSQTLGKQGYYKIMTAIN